MNERRKHPVNERYDITLDHVKQIVHQAEVFHVAICVNETEQCKLAFALCNTFHHDDAKRLFIRLINAPFGEEETIPIHAFDEYGRTIEKTPEEFFHYCYSINDGRTSIGSLFQMATRSGLRYYCELNDTFEDDRKRD